MRNWTHYWAHSTVESHEDWVGVPLVHAAGNLFKRRGVEPGDTVFFISFHEGSLRLISRFEIARMVDRREAKREMGPDLWDADEHILAKRRTSAPQRDDAWLTEKEARSIRFIDGHGEVVPPRLNRHKQLEPQTFRAVREITRDTAGLFDRVLRRKA